MATVYNATKNIRSRRDGFTVLEILVIVGILALVWCVMIPRMTEATNDDRESVLMGALHTLRSQLELYRVEHLNQYPCGDSSAPAAPELFVARLTEGTNADHTSGGDFGPYLETFPTNPFNGLNTVRYGADAGRGWAGWCFNPATGQLLADDGGQTIDGTAHRNF